MRLYKFHLLDNMRWNIHINDPKTWDVLPQLNGKLLNPFARLEGEPLPFSVWLGDDTFHALSNYIYFIFEDECETSSIAPAVEDWLKRLRASSKQISLPIDFSAFSSEEINLNDIELQVRPSQTRSGNLLGEHRVKTAITTAAIQAVEQWNTIDDVPLYDELLVDALNAFMHHRYRDSILYAAIAVESLAQYELTRYYAKALADTNPPEYLNILTIPVKDGVVVKKDPIYVALFESNSFGKLLHETPLYLIRRSLQVDDPELYRKALMLYGTRNQLGHGNKINKEDGNKLQLNANGSKLAVITALEIYKWFGICGYLYPDLNKVKTPKYSLI